MNLSDRYQRFHTSVYAGMYEDLAKTLGVEAFAIQQLGVGYDYKYQAWVFPERNVFGDIIGLSYRYIDGRKTMAPSNSLTGKTKNRRGLTYPFNQHYDSGDKRYSPGRHNWTRIADAGVRCPICHKPDWCVVSAENPSDPQAVLCKRIEEGSVKETEGGFLHVRKSSGRLTAAAKLVLPPSDLPLIIVEGSSDVLAAMSMGFIAIGRPNCGACSGLLSKMPLAGREVWVIGENDAGAGVKGMKETFAVVEELTSDVKMFLPPDGIKDLRQWYTTGLTCEELIEYAYDHGKTRSEVSAKVFDDAQPLTIAKAFIDQTSIGGKPTIVLYNEGHYKWTGRMYTPLCKSELNRDVVRFMEDKRITVETSQGKIVKPLPTGIKWARDIIFCLPVRAPIAPEPNVWLDDRPDRPTVDKLISFENGIMDVGEYLESGKVKMYDPDPDLFVLGSFPYAYDPNAECPEYEAFLRLVQEGDEDTVRMLQQWTGYVCVPDMSLEKMLMLNGKPRSGKGTIIETTQAMIGDTLCCPFKLPDLVNQFGMTGMLGKLLAVCGEVKDLRINMQQEALGNILRVVGRDAISVDKKYADLITNLHLKVRFMLAMNNLPTFHDDSMALAARSLPIKFNLSWMGREDPKLKDRMIAMARQGLLINWALRGLYDLKQEGHFSISARTEEQIQIMRGLNSPLRTFVDAMCKVGRKEVVQSSLLYKVWKGWCESQSVKPGLESSFGRRLLDSIDGVTKGRVQVNGKRTYMYDGIGLNHDAIEEYID